MPKYADYYLVINSEGRWQAICYAHPPKELDEKTDILLTPSEYQLLKELKSLERGYFLLDSVRDKINEKLGDNKNE